MCSAEEVVGGELTLAWAQGLRMKWQGILSNWVTRRV